MSLEGNQYMCSTYPDPGRVSLPLSEREKPVFSFLGGGREGAETDTAPFLLMSTTGKRPVVYCLPLEKKGCKCLSGLSTASELL